MDSRKFIDKVFDDNQIFEKRLLNLITTEREI